MFKGRKEGHLHKGEKACNGKEFAVGIDSAVSFFFFLLWCLVEEKDQNQGQNQQGSCHIPRGWQHVNIEFWTKGKDKKKPQDFVANEQKSLCGNSFFHIKSVRKG